MMNGFDNKDRPPLTSPLNFSLQEEEREDGGETMQDESDISEEDESYRQLIQR